MPKNKWNESFSSPDYVYGKEVNKFIKKEAERFDSTSNIACLAEGEGRNAVYLATLGHTITAYDISEVGLEKARTLANEHNVSISTKVIDLIEGDLPNAKYDHAILVFGHVHKNKQARLINNMINTVKPGGLIMFEVYSKKQIHFDTGGPGHLDYLYDPSDILELISEHDCKHFYYGEAKRFEGQRHNGKCHIIQVIIQKQA